MILAASKGLIFTDRPLPQALADADGEDARARLHRLAAAGLPEAVAMVAELAAEEDDDAGEDGGESWVAHLESLG